MDELYQNPRKNTWDKFGMLLSGFCLIHCFFVGLLPLIFPAVLSLTAADWIHKGLGILIVITSPLAFIPGHKKHGVGRIILQATLSVLLVLVGTLIEGKIEDWMSHTIIIIGSLGLVFSHYENIQHSKKQCC